MFHLGHTEAEEEARCRNAPEIWRLSGAYSMSFPIMLSLSSSLYRTTRRSGSTGMRASEGGMVVVGKREAKASDRPLVFDALSGTTFPGFLLSLGASSAIVETVCGGERRTSLRAHSK